MNFIELNFYNLILKMDKLLIHNLKNAKFVVLGFCAAHTFYWYALSKP